MNKLTQEPSTDRAGSRYSRRALLAGSLAVTGQSVLTGHGASQSATPEVIPPRPLELPQPATRSSVAGELAVTMTARPATVDMRAPMPVSTWTYDGIVPGNTWEVRPGDTLRIDLINDLPPIEHEPHPEAPHTGPHEWTHTNLHTHGLHVSPSGNSDNVFLSIPPGERQAYEITLPDDHPGGLFWYHPHRHGGVAQQLRAGMAGAIIVRGEIDEVEEVRAAKEQLMVLQAIELGDDFALEDPIPVPTTQQAFFPRSKVLYTINGALNPQITMYPGEIQRWRLLNAAEGKFMSLRLSDHDFHVLAWDGLTLAEPESEPVVMLSAGNRVDVLIKAGAPGTYSLVLTPGSSQKPDIPGMPDEDRDGQHPTTMPMAAMRGFPEIPGELEVRSILTVEVKGSGPEMQLPSTLPAWDPPMLPISRKRGVEYTVGRKDDNEFLFFGIDGAAFDPDRPPYTIPLGTAEEWTLVNGVDNKLHDHAHVFHIHVNPFRITRINGELLAKPLWRDTFVLTRLTGDSITFESNFVDFTGKFVNHCHIVSHEDLGMMEAIEVVP